MYLKILKINEIRNKITFIRGSWSVGVLFNILIIQVVRYTIIHLFNIFLYPCTATVFYVHTTYWYVFCKLIRIMSTYYLLNNT